MGIRVSRLDEITRAKAWLDGFRPLPSDILSELHHRFEVRLTYHSTAIEGNTLTQSETQIVLEKGVTIGGKSLREHLEVIGHREALEFIIELTSGEESFSERTVRELHNLVMKGQTESAGAYRGLNVMAAGTGFRYPDHLHVSQLMTEFVAWWNASAPIHPVLWAAEAHVRFVTIHPFQDGNGRVGRLLLNLAMLRNGYPITVLPVERRAEYIASLELAQSQGDRTAFDSIVLDAVDTSLRETLEVCVTARGAEVPEDLRAWLLGRP